MVIEERKISKIIMAIPSLKEKELQKLLQKYRRDSEFGSKNFWSHR
ncbi:hypothetical protein IX293_002158 [Fusobacterium necrophorum]|nr:hypothetical protein [Fusobacterium necrophorum]